MIGVPGAKRWTDEFADRIAAGRGRVVVIPDADPTGREAAERWAADLAERCDDVRLLNLHPDRDDGADLSTFAGDARTAEERRQAAELLVAAAELAPRVGAKSDGWLDGAPMDPAAVAVEPVPALPGFPFLHRGVGALISGPTGGGRSSLMEAGAYDAGRAGLRVAYLGSEVTEAEFHARAADLASRRGDRITDELRRDLERVRYRTCQRRSRRRGRTPRGGWRTWSGGSTL
ncbi:MAG: hypothetical protein M3P48_05150 [Actinomycetota bacterium]|nr:hypothetical protein [Actinomycetota bacterium]